LRASGQARIARPASLCAPVAGAACPGKQVGCVIVFKNFLAREKAARGRLFSVDGES